MTENDVQVDTAARESREIKETNGPANHTTGDDREDKQVPVSEAIRYRKRAQVAEQQLGDVQTQMQAMQAKLDQAQQTVTHLERRQRIDALLAESEAIDLDAARLLTERAVQEMDEPDVQAAVADLRRHKPYLFRKRISEGNGAMAPRLSDDAMPEAEDMAHRAATSGDRRDLLRYLRLRRRQVGD
ncbi:MAG: hypothetical protein WD118_07195 [Phycisphaeraceae bacterium]